MRTYTVGRACARHSGMVQVHVRSGHGLSGFIGCEDGAVHGCEMYRHACEMIQACKMYTHGCKMCIGVRCKMCTGVRCTQYCG